MTLALLCGALIGVVLGLTGAGGGVLAVPLLVGALGVPVVAASPIALAAVGLAASVGTVLAFRAGEVRYRAASLMAAVGAIASPCGMWLAQTLSQRSLLFASAGVLGWVSAATWQRVRSSSASNSALDAPCLVNPETGRLAWTRGAAMLLSALGAAAGTLSGLLGVGGGFVIVPGLQRLTNLPRASCVGTSLAVVALVSLAGVGASAAIRRIDLETTWQFSTGAVVGMLIANKVRTGIRASWLQLGFAALAAAVAAAMALKAVYLSQS